VALETVQNHPGITAQRLGERLGVSERAVRRYVTVLRAAGVPIESVRGRYGGYRVGRGLRLPPLMFTTPEALGLVMAVLEGRHVETDGADPVATALGKIIRVLPDPVAEPAEAVRRMSARGPDATETTPSPETTALLVRACAARRRLRLAYRLGETPSTMDVDPWAVVVRHGRWYLLCWSHSRGARRVLRVDRVAGLESLAETFEPPGDLDPVKALEEHLAEGWRYAVEVLVDAPVERVARWVPRSIARLEDAGEGRTRLVGTTDEPDWYAAQLARIEAPFEILGSPELREVAAAMGRRLADATR
jgi:predicted DNA-binding transcriptional regulator YafY